MAEIPSFHHPDIPDIRIRWPRGVPRRGLIMIQNLHQGGYSLGASVAEYMRTEITSNPFVEHLVDKIGRYVNLDADLLSTKPSKEAKLFVAIVLGVAVQVEGYIKPMSALIIAEEVIQGREPKLSDLEFIELFSHFIGSSFGIPPSDFEGLKVSSEVAMEINPPLFANLLRSNPDDPLIFIDRVGQYYLQELSVPEISPTVKKRFELALQKGRRRFIELYQASSKII